MTFHVSSIRESSLYAIRYFVVVEDKEELCLLYDFCPHDRVLWSVACQIPYENKDMMLFLGPLCDIRTLLSMAVIASRTKRVR